MHVAVDTTAGGGVDGIRRGYLWMVASTGALGGLLFGYDWVVIGGAKPFYERFFGLESQALIGWANSCALLGCLAGSAASGFLADRFGRRIMLTIAAILFTVTSLLTGAATSFSAFILWRILGGVAIGIASNVSPTYIAEISPATMRGRLTTLNQIAIVVGIVAAQLANWFIAQPVPAGASDAMIAASWNAQIGWRWMFYAVAAPSLLLLVTSLFIPESPRWLMMKGRLDAADEVFRRLGAGAAVRSRPVDPAADEDGHWRSMFSPPVRRALLIAVSLTVLQQWSGINVLFNYAEEVYRDAGYQLDGVMFNIVITGAVNLLFTLIALVTVDRFGRRWLMLIGCGCLALSHFVLGLSYSLGLAGWPILVATLCSIGIYGLSLAPVTWVLVVELFPTRYRAKGMSIATSALWAACFILTFTFPLLQSAIGGAGTFWIYAAVCFVGLILVWKAVPETMGRDLEDVGAAATQANATVHGDSGTFLGTSGFCGTIAPEALR